MIIKLKGELDLDLLRIGLRPGMEVAGMIENKNTGAFYFNHFYTISNLCVVWPENYDIILDDRPKQNYQFTIR